MGTEGDLRNPQLVPFRNTQTSPMASCIFPIRQSGGVKVCNNIAINFATTPTHTEVVAKLYIQASCESILEYGAQVQLANTLVKIIDFLKLQGIFHLMSVSKALSVITYTVHQSILHLIIVHLLC